ncbi:hypothetical protein SSCG_05583 [Streptomyces clavuligerus]|nr:hypothetical protein SSCG_05583 [Streptomyces clavuligerus]
MSAGRAHGQARSGPPRSRPGRRGWTTGCRTHHGHHGHHGQRANAVPGTRYRPSGTPYRWTTGRNTVRTPDI